MIFSHKPHKSLEVEFYIKDDEITISFENKQTYKKGIEYVLNLLGKKLLIGILYINKDAFYFNNVEFYLD